MVFLFLSLHNDSYVVKLLAWHIKQPMNTHIICTTHTNTRVPCHESKHNAYVHYDKT